MQTRIPHRATRAVVGAVLILATFTSADAKLAFQGPSRYFATGSTPTTVGIADLDRDGHADLVVTNSAVYSASRISSISILRGKGDGTFEPHHVIPVGNVPQKVVIEDFDTDGLLDLAISNFGEIERFEGSISVLLGNGDATFRAATDYPAGDKLRSLTAADLDGDGDLDLATEDAVLLGNGDGTFGIAAPFGEYIDWYATVADINRDGHMDLVTSNIYAEPNDEDDPWMRAYAVRLGRGDGTFGAPVRQGQGYRCMGLGLADLDGDALLDLVLVNHGDDRGSSSGVLVHSGRGDGSFGAARFFPTALNPMSVEIVDLNGDGKLDLATVNNGDDPDFDENSLTILLGNGDGTFQRGADLHAGESPVFVSAGRLDADANWDLVVVNQLGASVSVFLGNGDGTFGASDRPLGRAAPSGLAAGDFDGDGHVDLATSYWGSIYTGPGGASVILGRGDGSFGERQDLSLQGGRGSVTAGDLNGDLLSDLAFTGETDLSVMMANGDGTFRAPSQASTGYFIGRPVFADFDGDGRADLAASPGYGNSVSVLRGVGDGSFGTNTRFETGDFPSSVASDDLNGDGSPDLVVGLAGFSVSVLLGQGDGTFASQATYASGNYFANDSPVTLADLNEDGRVDVVSGNLVWIGNGDGTLRAGTKFDDWHSAMSVVVEDLDGDHHVDMALLYGKETRVVSVYPGRGDGTFGTRVDHGTGGWPMTMTAGDFDGDGRTDLAVSNHSSQSISLLLNRSQAPVISARLELRPAVVNPRAEARWITGILALEAPHSVSDIDIASIRLNGTVPVDQGAPGSTRRQGSRELIVRFDRAALAAALPAGEQVPVTITGVLGRDAFEGATAVRVVGRGFMGSPSGATRHPFGVRVLPPPRPGSLRLGISLSGETAARVDVIDVAGRVRVTRSLESFAAGVHTIELPSSDALAPGMYFVRLRQAALEAHARVAVVR